MAEILKETEFREKAKTFLNHKLILANVSHYYKCSFKKPQIDRIKLVFSAFLQVPKTYPLGQLALLIKRHEDLIINIIPIPGTPAYESSKNTAEYLIQKSGEIIDRLNLNELI
jgi:hypothetical protein